MAILATHVKAGVSVPNAYIRLEAIQGGKAGWTGGFRVYVNESEPLWFDEFRISASYSADTTPFISLYNAAKLSYEDATDV